MHCDVSTILDRSIEFENSETRLAGDKRVFGAIVSCRATSRNVWYVVGHRYVQNEYAKTPIVAAEIDLQLYY